MRLTENKQEEQVSVKLFTKEGRFGNELDLILVFFLFLGSSSPLGELFDHGCDALTTSFMTITVITSLQAGTTWISYYALMSALVVFFFAQWEQLKRKKLSFSFKYYLDENLLLRYYLGTLELGVINVTEAQYAVMSMHLLTAIFGTESSFSWESVLIFQYLKTGTEFWDNAVNIGGYHIPYYFFAALLPALTAIFTTIGK